jgi:hypothetical protein
VVEDRVKTAEQRAVDDGTRFPNLGELAVDIGHERWVGVVENRRGPNLGTDFVDGHRGTCAWSRCT